MEGSIQQPTTLTRWLAFIATSLVVAGLTTLPLGLIYNERRAERFDSQLADLRESNLQTAQRVNELDSEIRHPNGDAKPFNSDDGARLQAEISSNEVRLRALESHSAERTVLCQDYARRLSDVERHVDDILGTMRETRHGRHGR